MLAAWGAASAALRAHGLDVAAAFREPAARIPDARRSLQGAALLLGLMLLCASAPAASAPHELHVAFVLLFFALAALALAAPFDVLARPTREHCGEVLLSFAACDASREVSFSQLIVADALTSLSGPLRDVGWMAAFVLRAAGGLTPGPLTNLLPPLLASAPFCVRATHCVAMARATRFGPERGQHIANLCKYLCSLLPIWLPLLPPPLRDWTLASLALKALFCFYWDVVQDWGLGPVPLRRRLLPLGRAGYAAAVLFDAVMRAMPLVGALRGGHAMTAADRLLDQLGEVLRRGVWFALRVEWQLMRAAPSSPAPLAPLSPAPAMPPLSALPRRKGSLGGAAPSPKSP